MTALAVSLRETSAAKGAAAREQAGRAEAEFKAGTIEESLGLELEAERSKSRGLEEQLRKSEKVAVVGGEERDCVCVFFFR